MSNTAHSDGPDEPDSSDRQPITGVPRWVKLVGLVAVAIAVAFLLLTLAGIGDHGPSRHGDDPGRLPPLVAPEGHGHLTRGAAGRY
jgi:hypothetical protein